MLRNRNNGGEVDVDELISFLRTAPIRLAVFGEFSAGKTTVLNALIGEEILSVAVEPTTAVPTRVRYGREFNIFVHRSDDVPLQLFEEDPPFWTRFVGRHDTLNTLKREKQSLREFLRKWTKEGEAADEVERVEIQLPHEWLKGGLELVDTPGVNNEFTRHHGFTEQEAATADIALLLMDARQGGGKRTEFDFMNMVQRQVPRCIVVANKMDLIDADEREEFLEYILDEALPQHWNGAVTPPVIGISALAALHPGQNDEPELTNSFQDLKNRLEKISTEKRGTLLLARRGNPVQTLFAEAKALEAESQFDKAHRIYFDVLDILDAASLNKAPAEEGIQRCERHLISQVKQLDALNERYNEASGLDKDPDGQLQELMDVKSGKADLGVPTTGLELEIEALEKRIEGRDKARQAIERITAEVERLRDKGTFFMAVNKAEQLPRHIEEAELPKARVDAVHAFIEQQVQDRSDWARRRWNELRVAIGGHLDQHQYPQAMQLFEEFRKVAPYANTVEETDRIASEVIEEAEKAQAYRIEIYRAAHKAEGLLNPQLTPEKGKEIVRAIEAATSLYRETYGAVDAADCIVDKNEVFVDIEQKLNIAQALGAISMGNVSGRSEQIISKLNTIHDMQNT